MKVISATVLGLALLSGAAPAFAQPYGGRDYGYDRGDYGPRDEATEIGATAIATAATTIGTMTEARGAGVATMLSTRRSICAAIQTCAERS